MTRRPRVLEKTEQASGVQLLARIGAKPYVLGRPRRKGDYPGTMQTKGIADVVVLLPRALGVLFWEAKAAGGKLTLEQAELRDLVLACTAAGRGVYHCAGGYDALIATLMNLGLLKPDPLACRLRDIAEDSVAAQPPGCTATISCGGTSATITPAMSEAARERKRLSRRRDRQARATRRCCG